ncbi:MAG: hypothetical protein AAFZ74_01960 [Pseudomonadota bacterium]
MSMVSQEKVDAALTILADKEGVAASSRAAHEYEQDRLKVIKARLMARCNEKSIAAREMYALSHEDYETHLKHVRELAELRYHNQDRRKAAEAIVDVWRSENATNRTFARAAS